MLGTARVEPLIRRIRNSMQGAGMRVENSKGECNFGQHEINFRYDEALATADEHVIYKTGRRRSPPRRAGAHLHGQARRARGQLLSHPLLAPGRGRRGSVFAERREDLRPLRGRPARGLRELTLLFAPQINSYKRFVEGSFAPTAVAWGRDNRTCSMRVVGHGEGLRVENRLPGADVNPYLALAAMSLPGCTGSRRSWRSRRRRGQRLRVRQGARAAHAHAARDLFAAAELAREAFGEEVVDHYLNRAEVELDAFEAAVTDWERFRGFERL